MSRIAASAEECAVENIVGIVLGFALTTVAGGWWAARLQERSWVRQNDIRLREAENERAAAACQDLMSLLDRRLYRMKRLLWAADGAAGDDEIERRLQVYVDILFAWNDRLNTNLSLVGSYFGDEARAYLDGLYEDYKRVGQGVEAVVRAARAGEATTGIADNVRVEFQGRQAGSLNDRVYQFGLMLMSQLREGQVGRSAPNKSKVRSTT
jgi:hypothetical protein